jgi:hypothetical protein
MATITAAAASDSPMIKPNYIIYESPLWTECKTQGLVSRLINNKEDAVDYSKYSATEKLSLIEVHQYLTNETSKLFANIKLAEECDTAISKQSQLPSLCSEIFSNFSKDQITTTKNNIISNGSIFDSSPFDNLSYTEQYIQSKMSQNDKKMLCQRYADILQMLSDYSHELITLNDPSITDEYLDKYKTIMNNFNNNNTKRNNIADKLSAIYGENSVYDDSRKFMDSTIYVSVLWTILATTTLFYIFKKI